MENLTASFSANCRPVQAIRRPQYAAFRAVVCLTCILVGAKAAPAATYYVDAVNGDDSNPGTSAQPWKTLDRAYTWYSGDGPKVQEGDTVYFRDGNYGEFRESTRYNPGEKWLLYRNDWVTYKADIGHSPTLSKIEIHNQDKWGDIVHGRSYLIFDGFTVSEGVSLQYTSYVQVRNCEIAGEAPPYSELSTGFYAPYVYGSGIEVRYSHYITLEDNEISTVYRGVGFTDGTTNIVIRNNNIHYIGEDGIVVSGATNATVEDNTVYDLHPYRALVDIRGTKTGDFTAGEEVVLVGKTARGIFHRWVGSYASIYQTTSANFKDEYAAGDILRGQTSGATLSVTYVDPQHTDGITLMGSEDVILRGNTVIRRRLGGANGQGLKVDRGINITIENNILDASAHLIMIDFPGMPLEIANMNNNTFYGTPGSDGRVRIYLGTGANRDITINNMYNNIIHRLVLRGDVADNYTRIANHGNNIFGMNPNGTGGPSYPFEVNSSSELVNYDIDKLFVDAEGGDFHLASDSAAIDFGNASYGPSTDKDGNARVGAPDAGCYEYIASEAGNSAPVLDAIGDKTVAEGSSLTFSISATDADDETLTYSASNLPSGASFSGQTFSWTPGYDQAGTYDVTFTASDGTDSDSESVTITVANTNRAPVLAAIDDQSVNEGSLLTISLSATDADDDTVSFSAGSLPAGSVFSGSTFIWTPTYSQAGTFELTFTASDGTATDSQSVTVTVNNVNRAPVLDAIPDKSVSEASLLTFEVSATDPDGESLTYSAVGLPSGASFSGQTFSWTPSHAQADNTYQVTFTASDGSLEDSQVVTITVTDNSAPVVTNCSPAADSIQVPLNKLIVLHITDDGKGVDPGSVTIRLDGDIIYTGDTASYVSATGTCRRIGTKSDYTFAYQADQKFDFDQTKTITVNAADLAGNTMPECSYSFRTEMRSFGQNEPVGADIGEVDRAAPSTAVDSGGNIWAVWHAGPAGSRDIYIARLAAGATSFGSSTRITTSPADQCNPDIALGGDDKLYVVWQDNRLGDWDIYGATSADGTSWSAQRRISDSNDNQTNPAVAVDSGSPNRAYVVWQDDGSGNQDIYIAASSNGFGINTITRITSNTADQTDPAIAIGSSNAVYVVWADARGSSLDIYGAASDSWTNVPVVTKAAAQSEPAIAAEAAGSIIHLLWTDAISGESDIYYAASDGLPASPLVGTNLIDDTSGADQLSPTIAVTGSSGANLKVFAAWLDKRNVSAGNGDTDLYMTQTNSGHGTNILVGDGGTNSSQSQPVMGVDRYGYPYVLWTDGRDANTQIYYAASTYMRPTVVSYGQIVASAGGTVGADPEEITSADDVSVVVPEGTCPYDVTIRINKIENPQQVATGQLGSYDFGPSGLQFSEPVTITIPYTVSATAGSPSAYWYDSLTGTLSQQGITDMETVELSPGLQALRFKTTHFTPFYVVAAVAGGGGGGGGGGGCTMSPVCRGSVADLLVPYLCLAAVIGVFKLRDRRRRGAVRGTEESV